MIVKAHLAGTINYMYADEGERVEENQKLLNIESMKMQFDILSPCAGVVRYKTSLGKIVAKGDVIVEII